MPDKPRAVRVSDPVWEKFTDAVTTRRRGETTVDFKERLKAGASGPLKLAAEAYAADPEGFETACQNIIRGAK